MLRYCALCLFLLFPATNAAYKYEDFQEEDVVGLEELLARLDSDTQDLVIELLEAKQIQNLAEQDQMMRLIMRKQTPASLDALIRLYKQTGAHSSTSSRCLLFPAAIFLSFLL